MERNILKYNTIVIIIFLLIISIQNKAQNNDTSKWNISLNVETYYNYHLLYNKKSNNTPFLVSFNQNNSPNINFLNANIQYLSKSFRFQISPMYGTYAQYNLSSEPPILQTIDRLNIELKLHPQKQIWLCAGIMSSHIGVESNYGHENALASRAITADNTPYYETGLRISYNSDNNKWLINFNILNGWQNILYSIKEQLPSFGHQIQYKPNKNWTFNSSSFIGFLNTDHPRFFHNAFLIYNNHQMNFTTFFDIGFQKYTWNSYGIIISYAMLKNILLSIRFEKYTDPHNIIMSAILYPVNVSNLSSGINFNFLKYFQYKIEYRYFWATHPLFHKNDLPYALPFQPIIYNTLIFHL